MVAMARRLDALTSLRFVGAAMIVVYHSHLHFGFGRSLAATVHLEQAVSFFFVLSGFVLTYAYPRLLPGEWRSFLWARVARLWPLHALTFLAVVTLLPAGSRTPPGASAWLTVPLNLTLLQAWIPVQGVSWSFNGPTWATSVEAAFYVSFIVLIHRWNATWWWKIALATIAVGATIAYANVWAVPAAQITVYMHPLARCLEFVLGMLTCTLWRRLAPVAPTRRSMATLLECAAIVVVVLVMRQSTAWAMALRPLWFVQDAGALWLVNAGLPAPAFAALIAVFAGERGALSAALRWRVLVGLGSMSYAIYVVHHPAIRVWTTYRLSGDVSPTMAEYGVFLTVVLAASYVAWRWVELPARRLLLRYGPG